MPSNLSMADGICGRVTGRVTDDQGIQLCSRATQACWEPASTIGRAPLLKTEIFSEVCK